MNNIDKMNLVIKLINLEVNQEILGEILFQKFNLNNKSEWYNLTGLLIRYFSIDNSRSVYNSRFVIQSKHFINDRYVRDN
jgi:hypothetical protein